MRDCYIIFLFFLENPLSISTTTIRIMNSTKGEHGNVLNSSPAVLPPAHRDLVERWMRFYRAKFHLFTIPVGIIISIIHLKFAIQYLGQCPIQPMINVYMIVQGAITIFLMLLATVGVVNARCIHSRSEEIHNKRVARCLVISIMSITLVLVLFSLAWLIVGSVWIFGAKSNGAQGSDSTITTTYCESDLLSAAVTLIIVHYITHGLLIGVVIFRRFCKKREDTVVPPVAATDKI
jgi:hypothetical protein